MFYWAFFTVALALFPGMFLVVGIGIFEWVLSGGLAALLYGIGQVILGIMALILLPFFLPFIFYVLDEVT